MYQSACKRFAYDLSTTETDKFNNNSSILVRFGRVDKGQTRAAGQFRERMGIRLKLSVEEIDLDRDEEIIVRCHEMNDEILKMIRKIKLSDTAFVGYDEDRIHKVRPEEIFYFESVDNKTFIYCKDKVFESRQKLYEIEEQCEGSRLFRASKSIIVNASKISYIRPAFSGRFEAKLSNGEDIVISRQFVPVLKKMLGLL